MGPLAGWYRLRLLREILDELVPGVEQFLLVNNVVAVEDGAALVPGQEHGDPFGDVRADQVARGSAAAIVEEAGRHPGGLTGGAPRRAPAANGNAVAVEDQRALGVAACPPSVQRVGDGRRDGERWSSSRRATAVVGAPRLVSSETNPTRPEWTEYTVVPQSTFHTSVIRF